MTTIRSTSHWNADQITDFLDDTLVPIRLSCVTADGSPLVCSLWYFQQDGMLWCATQETAALVKYLENEPRCGFEIAPDQMPYRGVRGQGVASISKKLGAPALETVINRYFGSPDSDFAQWLLSRADEEVAIGIKPEWFTSWDFSDRMPAQGA